MDMFISMKAENLNKGIYFEKASVMQMPTAQGHGHFIADFMEGDEDKLRILKRYADMLNDKLDGQEGFFIQHTSYGFKLLKPVDEDMEYIDAWESWVKFTRRLLREIEEVLGE